MAIINEEMKNIKGFYCGYCNTFYNVNEVKKTYKVEVVGKVATITNEGISCPECSHHIKDFEEFEPEWWSHLSAMVNKKYKDAVWIKVPIYDNDNDIFPVSYKTVRTTDEVEELAGRFCIDVVKATIDDFGLVDIEVEFC